MASNAQTEARIVLTANDKTKAAFASAKANIVGTADAANGLAKKLGTLAGALVAADQVMKLRGAVDELDRLDDLSEKYGIAAKSLAAYTYASQVAGTETESFVIGLNKLSKNAAAAAGGDKALQQVFKTLAVNVTDASGKLRSADDILGDLADRFAGYEDGLEKAALAQEVFGKTGADMIPLLNKGRAGIESLKTEAQQLGLVYGDEVAKAAGDFNDNLKRLELASHALYLSIASELLPKLLELSNALIESKKNGTVLADLWERIKGNAGFSDFDIQRKKLENLNHELNHAASVFEEWQDAVKKNPHDAEYTRQMNLWRQEVERLMSQTLKASDAFKGLANNMKPLPPTTATGFGGSGRDPGVAVPGKKAAPIIDKQAATDAEKAAKAYEDLVGRIREKTSANEEEILTGKALSDEQKLALDIVGKLADRETKFTVAQKQSVTAMLETLIARGRANDKAKESAALLQAEARALAAAATARDDENKRLRDQFEEIGLTVDQLERLRIKRLEDKLALDEERLATLKLMGADADMIRQREQLIDAERQSIELTKKAAAARKAIAEDESRGIQSGVQDYLDVIAKKGDAAREAVSSSARALEDDLVDSFKTGKLNVKSFIDTVISEFIRLKVVRPLLDSLFKSIPGFGGGSGGGGGGGDWDWTGAPQFFAKGDIFDSPTLFRFANGGRLAHGVMGEAGPEAVMPLTRAGNGKLGVVAQNAGGEMHIDLSGQTLVVGQGVSRAEMYAAQKQNNAILLAQVQRMASQGRIG
jgi:lambda family phage tail tape measure protein